MTKERLGHSDITYLDINDPYFNYSTYHAFLYENNQMQDLNSLIPQDSGWSLEVAYDINTAGQIVGGGQMGEDHAFLYIHFYCCPTAAKTPVKRA